MSVPKSPPTIHRFSITQTENNQWYKESIPSGTRLARAGVAAVLLGLYSFLIKALPVLI